MQSSEKEGLLDYLDVDELLVRFGLGGWLAISALLVLVLALGSIFGIIYILVEGILDPSSNSQVVTTSIEIFAVVVNGLLTIAIILLYLDIRDSTRGQEGLMRKQNKIYEEQQKLREATYQPDLRCEIRLSDVVGNQVPVKCYNDGPGRADNIDISLDLFVYSGDFNQIHELEGQNFTPVSAAVEPSEHETEHGVVELREGFYGEVRNMMYVSGDGQRKSKRAAVAGRDKQKFRFSVAVNHYRGVFADPGEGHIISIEQATERLKELGYTAIAYRLSVKYENIIGESVDDFVFSSGVTELQSGMTFEEIVNSSSGEIGSIEIFGNSIHSVMFW